MFSNYRGFRSAFIPCFPRLNRRVQSLKGGLNYSPSRFLFTRLVALTEGSPLHWAVLPDASPFHILLLKGHYDASRIL